VVRCIVETGAILVGKTNMDQFATGLVGTRTSYGACASVVSSEHVSGGSSSGSAVAVAAGIVSFALGTDTAGSGRVPVAFNAIVWLKPTIGRLSTGGVLPACRTLDCVSIFTRDAADADAVLAAADCFDPADPFARQVPVPAPTDGHWALACHARRTSLNSTTRAAGPGGRRAPGSQRSPTSSSRSTSARSCRWLGCSTRAPGWPSDTRPLASSSSARTSMWTRPSGRSCLAARSCSAADAFRGLYRLAELRRTTEAVWERIDVLALPTAPTHPTHAEVAADPVGVNARLGTWTNFVNLLDLAAVAAPAAPRDDGLPFGVTFTAPAWSYSSLLGLAAALERAVDPEIDVAVVGAHLSGMARNRELIERGARLVRSTRTASCDRLFDLAAARGASA